MVTNVLVTLRPGESQEKLLKRFSKKCKKGDIVKEFLEKTSFYKKPSQKKKDKILKNKWLRNKKKSHKRR